MANTLYKVLFVFGYIVAIGLLGLGAIFLMAYPASTLISQLITGIVMIVVGMVLIIGLRLRQKVTVEQKVTLKPKHIKQMKCRECAADLSEKDVTVKDDIVIVKCSYCGALYELADEPIW